VFEEVFKREGVVERGVYSRLFQRRLIGRVVLVLRIALGSHEIPKGLGMLCKDERIFSRILEDSSEVTKEVPSTSLS
jgi:hypothetical protein